jgi:hypothetical protein
MNQMGHTSAALTLEVYTRVLARDRDTGTRADELLRGPAAVRAESRPETPDDATDAWLAALLDGAETAL